MRRTATTGHAILGLLALRPEWTTYALTKQLRRNMRFFWPRAESRIYDEAKRLVARGLATARREATGRRGRTVYAISPAGRDAVQRWLATPPRPTALECEPLLRVLLADLGTRAQLMAALAQVEADAEAILAVGRTVGPEYLAGVAPFQDQIETRALVFDFLWSHALMMRRWAERAEATIAAWDDQTPAARDEAARTIIRRHLQADEAAAACYQ
ncbi:MAG TPA: PadR family transcriptional regulator [Thermomicrobiales bacterium]|nr:PadR family transcriptional regulator [Thermomicrobiales bacterium]